MIGRYNIRSLPISTWGWLTILIACSVVLRFWVSLDYPAPWILDDELIYIELAKSYIGSGVPTRGVGGAGLYFVYPALIAPAFALFDDPHAAYTAVKFINCVVMSSAAIPAYLLARKVLDRNYALLVCLLTLAVPSMVYTAAAMQENVYYPAFLWSSLAIYRVLERPTALRQAVALLAIASTFFIRNQALALVGAFVLALASQALLERMKDASRGPSRWSRFSSFGVTWLAVGSPILLVLGGEALGFGWLEHLAGQNSFVLNLPRELYVSFLERFPAILMSHIADLDLYVGVLPFAALCLLAVRLLRNRIEDPALRAFTWLAVWVTACNLGMVASFLTLVNQPRIADRNLFMVTPFFFIALCRLVADSPANRRRLLAPGLVLCLLPLVLDFTDVDRGFLIADSFAILAFSKLQVIFELGAEFVWVLVAALLVAVVGTLQAKRLYRWIPAGVLLFLLALHSPIVRATSRASSAGYDRGVPVEASDWIDEAVEPNARVVSIWHGSENRYSYWHGAFFNKSLSAVHSFFEPSEHPESGEAHRNWGLDRLSTTQLQVELSTGELVRPDAQSIQADYVLTSGSLELAAPVVASDEANRMLLHEVDGPVRVLSKSIGISSDGWTRPRFGYQLFNLDEGLLELQLHANSSVHERTVVVTARLGEEELGSITIAPGDFKNFVVPYPSSLGGWCRIDFEVSESGAPDLKEGQTDGRELGVVCSEIRRLPRPAIFGLFAEGLLDDGWSGLEFQVLLSTRVSGQLSLRLWGERDNGLVSQEVRGHAGNELIWTGPIFPGVQGCADLEVEAVPSGFHRLQFEVSPAFVPDRTLGNGDLRELGIVPGSFLFVSPVGLRAELGGVHYDSWTEPDFSYSVKGASSGELSLYLECNGKVFADGQAIVGRVEGREVLRALVGADEELEFTFPIESAESEGLRVEFEVLPTTHSLPVPNEADERDLGLLLRGVSFVASEPDSD